MKRGYIFSAGIVFMASMLCSVLLISCNTFHENNDTGFRVYSTIPSDFTMNVILASTISITFSNEVDPDTVNNNTIMLLDEAGSHIPIKFFASEDSGANIFGVTVTFQPWDFYASDGGSSMRLQAQSTYTVIIKSSHDDPAGFALKSTLGRTLEEGDYTFSFTTGS